jgi:sodium-dependent dicarboxylate transporter 2/3/5
VQRLGRLLGPGLALLAYALLPDTYERIGGEIATFSQAGRATAAIAVWMAVWWLTEAIPVYATALLPLAVLPLVGAASMREAAAPYAHELIFLFMGGFLIALAMERWGLHRRIALSALRVVGDRPTSMVGGFMVVTAALSMWVSNTATAIMMLPVALSVIDLVARQAGAGAHPETDPLTRNFGTPPNLFLLSFAREQLGRDISFARWLGVGLPLALLFLPIAWVLLTRVLYPIGLGRVEGADLLVQRELTALGPISRPERITLAVFAAASGLWITRPLLPVAGLGDAGIAMLAALALFVARVDRERAVLDWETAVKLPWGILVLFGGGLSLAAAIRSNGVGELLGAQVAGLAGAPALLVVLLVVAGIIFLTELTSNTATTATLIPILAALAPGLGLDPLLLAVPAALAASCAFMLPVATPPNAVVFGSGHVTIAEMSRAGLWLNVVGIALIPLVTWVFALRLL